MNIDREIKVGPKMVKRLFYLGFREANLNIDNIPEYQIKQRYFTHPSKLQVRIDVKDRTITVLDAWGNPIKSKKMFLTSEMKELIEKESKKHVKENNSNN